MLNNIAALLGTGAATSASSFESIATASLNGVQTITFSSIPSTYKSLQLRMIGLASGGEFRLRLNGDTAANYARHSLFGYNNTTGAAGYASANAIQICIDVNARASFSSTYPTVAVVDIIDYANTTKNKTVKSFGGIDANAAAQGEIDLTSGVWLSTSAVNSVTVFNINASNFAAGSQVALYGIKG